MLIHPERVVAEGFGVLELIHVTVVEKMALLGIEERVGDIDPDRAILLAEIRREVRPGHEVEPGELHLRSLLFGRRSAKPKTKGEGRAIGARGPGGARSRATATADAKARERGRGLA